MSRLLPLVVCATMLLTAVAAFAVIPDPVKLDTGSISGIPGTTPEVRVFKGIPFAAPPVGSLRWRAPQPAAHWEGVRKADQFGARCMQGGGGGGGGRGGAARGGAGGQAPAPAAAAPPVPALPPVNEDCLYLNVWTSAKNASDRLPVIVFVYGGGFTSGHGSEARYDGEALARKGSVFVTLNYRLGVFGLMAHPELTKESGHNASGNYAMMDVIAALRWVQKNISAFGGDPKRVTIMGESAGAILISSLSASPEGKGLFHRVIAESGAWMGLGIGKMTTLAQAEEVGNRVAMTMNAPSLAKLREIPAQELLTNSRFNGSLVVDGWIVPEDVSLTFAKGKQNEVDVLVGSNQDEGTFLSRGGTTLQQFNTTYGNRFADQLDSFKKLYPASSDAEATTQNLARVRDEVAWHMLTWARLQSKQGKSKTYVFYFTRVPPGYGERGATHTAELPYAFNNLIGNTPWTDLDRKLADTMTSYWVNFAANGDPNGKGLPQWPAFKDKTSERTMVLGDKVEASPSLEPARIALYDADYTRQKREIK
jgi:para-nitrobenzyl esterase